MERQQAAYRGYRIDGVFDEAPGSSGFNPSNLIFQFSGSQRFA